MADDSEDTAKINPFGTEKLGGAPTSGSVPPARHSSEKAFPAPPPPAPATSVPLWSVIAVAAVALAGLVLSVIALLRGGSGSEPESTQHISAHETENPDDARARVCDAAATVRQAVIVNTNLHNPDPQNPMVTLAVTTSARLALTGGGSYLHDVLNSAPASPTEVSEAVRAYADAIGSLGTSYLANNIDPEQQVQSIHNVDTTAHRMGQVCPMPEPPAAPAPAPLPGEDEDQAPGESDETTTGPGEGQAPAAPGGSGAGN